MASRFSIKGRASGLFCLLLAACAPASDAPSGFAPGLNAERRYDAAQWQRGRAIYAGHCASCHGDQGEGRTHPWNVRGADGFYPPPPLNDDAHAWHHSSKVLMRTIREGSPQGQGNMPAWRGKLSEADIADAVVYITSLWSVDVYRQWFAQIEAPARRGEVVR